LRTTREERRVRKGFSIYPKALKRRSENLTSARRIFENWRRLLKGYGTVTRVAVLYRADETLKMGASMREGGKFLRPDSNPDGPLSVEMC
jgi:hypothetical protein